VALSFALVAAILVAAEVGWSADPPAATCNSSSSVAFETPFSLDSNHPGMEPVINVSSANSPDYRYWVAASIDIVAGTTNASYGKLWNNTRASSSAGNFSEPPFEDFTGDATVFAGADGRTYWSALANESLINASHPREVIISRRFPANQTWQSNGASDTRIFTEPNANESVLDPQNIWDRPWFVQNVSGEEALAIATLRVGQTAPAPELREVYVFWHDDTTGMWKNRLILSGDGIAGHPTRNPNGTILIPLMTDLDVNDAQNIGGHINYAWAANAIYDSFTANLTQAGPDNATQRFPWSVADDAGNAYFVYTWGNGTITQVRYAFKEGAEWKVCIVGEVAKVLGNPAGELWGASAVAGSEGRLAVAWYGKNTSDTKWQVRSAVIKDANWPGGTTPTIYSNTDVGTIVAARAADASVANFLAFKDFLTIDKFPDTGKTIVAYTCLPGSTGNCDTGIGDSSGHVFVAQQSSGEDLYP